MLSGTAIVALWLAAWYLSRKPHLDARLVRWGARALLVILPLVVVAVVVWWVSPPKQTVVLVADFTDPTGVDSALVTQSLVDGMRETLKSNSDFIAVKRLDQTIPAEGGSNQARAIGKRPEHKAAFVIWGDYTLVPDPELHVHFDILRQTETYLGGGQTQNYGPAQVQQPTMFDFKLSLSNYLGELTAFASGLALFDAGNNKEAIPLFDTAARAVGQPLAKELERPIRFYRGTNFMLLGRAHDAQQELQALAPASDKDVVFLDDTALAVLINLGIVALDQGDYMGAKVFHEKALTLARQLGNRLGEAAELANLGNVALAQGDYVGAKVYHEQALALHRQLGNRQGEATDLGNLGLLALDQGDFMGAKVYHEQALAFARQLGDRLSEAGQLGNLGQVSLAQGD